MFRRRKMLKFNNGKFKILIFGDIHECEDYKTSPNFKDMQKLMNAALDEYKPDLCVLMGDNCSTGNIGKDPDGFRKMMEAVTAPIRERKIPAAVILGNHEHDHGFEKEVVEICGSTDGLIMRNDAPKEITGSANFKELIYSADGSTPEFCLWFIDSNNCGEDKEVCHYDFVHSDQIKWFEDESAKLKEMNGGKPMPAFIFQHIPVPEEYQLFRKAKLWELPWATRGFRNKSSNFYMLKKGCKGYLGEGPCSPDINNGQFASWKRVGGILAAFFGHDHLNDFSGFVDGIYLAQHKTSGFRAYTDGCHSMVRCVTIDEKNPEAFTDEIKHFKEFGLKCECLGPIFRNLTDRESRNIHIAADILYAAGGIAAAVIGTKLIKSKGGRKNG